MSGFLRFGSLLFALLIAVTPVYLAALPEKPTDAVVGRLESAQLFAVGGVGIAGRISDGQKAFEEIVARPKDSALETFEHLYATGNAEAKAYALLGIHIIAPSRFAEIYASIPSSEVEVKTMQGCIVDRMTLHQIATYVASGDYDKLLHRPTSTAR